MKAKKIPEFENEQRESKFWQENDTNDFVDWKKAKPVQFPNLKPSLKSISIRLPESMIVKLKVLANKKDVPYQSLMKIYLEQDIEREFSKK